MNRMKYSKLVLLVVPILLMSFAFPIHAQDTTTSVQASPTLVIYTPYPSEVLGFNEALTFDLTLHATVAPQDVDLTVKNLPDGWTSSFRGGGHAVSSVYVVPSKDTTVQLYLTAPTDLAAGTYNFDVEATGKTLSSELPMSLTFEERQPASLLASVDLPTVQGKADTTFHYNLTLQNTGSDPITVDLTAAPPQYLTVTFKSGTQEVTSIPIEANQSKRIGIDVSALVHNLAVDSYPIKITATSGDLTADTTITAQVVGQADVLVTTPDGRLSGTAEVGSKTPITLVLENQGSAPAQGIQLSATKPSGWTVDFNQDMVDVIQPGQQVQVTANIQPPDKAIAGDYVLTFRATPKDSTQQSADYRVTVQTSTLWGIIGIALIAAAVVIIGLSVMRFGRR